MERVHTDQTEERPILAIINRLLVFILSAFGIFIVIITIENKTSAAVGGIFSLAGLYFALFPFSQRLFSKIYSLLVIIVLYIAIILFVCNTSLKFVIVDTYESIISYLWEQPPPTIEEIPEDDCLISNSCLLSDVWNIYPKDSYLPDEDVCLPFPGDWGIDISCNEISIFPTNTQTGENGNTFYLVLDGNFQISFDLIINKLSGNGELAYLGFGVSPINPETTLHDTTRGIFFQRESIDDFLNYIYYKDAWIGDMTNYLRKENGGYKKYTPGTNISLSFLIEGNSLRIYESNIELIDPIPIQEGNRGFWIAYYFKGSGEINATISNILIKQKE